MPRLQDSAEAKRVLYRPFLNQWLDTLPDGRVLVICKDVLMDINRAIEKGRHQRTVVELKDEIPPLTAHTLTKYLSPLFIKRGFVYSGTLTPENRDVIRSYW